MKRGWCLMLAAAVFAGGQVLGQGSATVTAEPDAVMSMQDLEQIYREQLKARHIPLLGRYLTELQRLASESSEPAAFEEEMARVRGWIENGGVVDLRVARRYLDSEEEAMPMPKAAPPPVLGPLGRNWIVLTPDLAEAMDPETTIASAADGVEVHEIEWRIESLPEGLYEVVLRYSSPQDSGIEVPVRLELGSLRLDDEVPPMSKRSKGEYRLANLGRLSVPAPLEGETLTLRVLGGEQAQLRIFEVLVAPLNPLLRKTPLD